MRVLFYTGGYTHTMYRNQAQCAPPGVQYIPSTPELFKTDGLRQDFHARRKWWYEPQMRCRAAGTAALRRLGAINIRRIRRRDCRIIHSAQYLLWSPNDWVLDFEDASVFTWYSPSGLSRPWARALIRRRLEDTKCKAILPWTEAARRSLISAIDSSRFAHKIHVVYPALAPKKRHARPSTPNAKVHLLFVGTRFYEKGGWETLLACERVARHFPIHLTMVTYPPEEALQRFRAAAFVEFHSGISPAQLERLYRTADAFVLPVHTDTFGFVYLEAMSYELPCIGSTSFAVPEIIQHGHSGLLVNVGNSRFAPDGRPLYEPILHHDYPLLKRLRQPSEACLDSLATAISRLVQDSALRQAMGAAGWLQLAEGRFSFEHRNAVLAEIYRTATYQACGPTDHGATIQPPPGGTI